MTNSRRQGLNFERRVINLLAEALDLRSYRPKEKNPQIGSTRQFSKEQDNRGVDIWFSEDADINLAIQCKKRINNTKKKSVDVMLLENINDPRLNVLFYRMTKKNKKRESLIGEYAVLHLEDFIELLKSVYNGEQRYYESEGIL